MNRHLARLLPMLALLLLAVFVCQVGFIATEQAGLVCCHDDAGDVCQQKDDHGHCCSHAHPSLFRVSSPISINGPLLSHQQTFPWGKALAPEEPCYAIDQPPKLS
ncbi:hypothetical protein [Verrucomicrobium sp. GAS474]|uniref:hypothetical protein n=1 Tax=Verrucomicrobium sp. GAS474 TaxID=1882831 RepID=UPI000B86BA46|nr:hypothetical protein [Verrucomicrobium sp. GAS474]